MSTQFSSILYITTLCVEENNLIEIKNLKIRTKQSSVFEDLSIELCDGNSYAIFLGKERGKTTLASTIAGAIDADEGEILIDGVSMSSENKELKSTIGFYSADIKLLGFLSVFETLGFYGAARGADAETISLQIDEAIDLVGLTDISECSVASLSVYQRAKLGIATTLMGKPSLLIYDDIFKGLDEKETEQIADLIKMIASKKRTILICSSPDAASKCCSHAVFIVNGKVVLSDSIKNIECEINKTLEMRLEIRGDMETIEKKLSDIPEIIRVNSVGTADGNLFAIEYRNDPQIKDKLFAAMAEISSPILSYETNSLSISDVYHSLINNKSHKKAGAEVVGEAEKEGGIESKNEK